MSTNLKIALVHDWLLGVGGAENVLKELHEIFPDSPVYVLFYNEKFVNEFMPNAEIRPSFLQKHYRRLKNHKLLMPFMPMAVESFDMADFDIVISSSAYFAKGLIVKPRTRHICYCHSPTRQLWDWHIEYKSESKKTPRGATSLLQHFVRIWDRHASSRVDNFIANSQNVSGRIKKYYQKDSTVIYPPVSSVGHDNATNTEKTSGPRGFVGYQLPTTNYFLIVSRLFPHKNVEIAVKAFNKLGWPLIIIGDGPEKNRLKKIADKNIQILGFLSEDELQKYYSNCLAFIMPQEEDFGITPIEAMGYGKPVLALKRGGALEYIEPGINGEFFADPHPDVLAYNALRLKQNIKNYDPEKIKRTAERFSKNVFRNQILNLTAQTEFNLL